MMFFKKCTSLFFRCNVVLDGNQSLLLASIRGGAVILVLIAHTQQIMISPYWNPYKDRGLIETMYSSIGSYGVMLFFVLSGFFIFLSIQNNIKKNNYKSFDLFSFAKSRLARLYPPLIMSLVFVVILYYILDFLDLKNASQFSTGNEIYLARKELNLSFPDIFGSMFYLNGIIQEIKTPTLNGPLWSLAHEFWFYVVGGALVASIYKKSLITFFLVVILFLYWNATKYWFWGFYIWLAGAGSALIYANLKNKSALIMGIVLSLLLGFTWFYMVIYSADSPWMNDRQQYFFGYFFASILPLILRKNYTYKGLIIIQIVKWLAGISKYAYTLYLLHFPITLFTFILMNKIVQQYNLLFIFEAILTMFFTVKLSRVIGLRLESTANKKIVRYVNKLTE
jgi:peptidoglycan/LPS O-acetylase OafA/YrhL